MKKAIIIIALLIIGVAGAAGYLKMVLPDVGPAPQMEVALTPERIAQGEYLATHVAACMDCHSTRDWSRFSAPLQSGTLGKGGEYFGPEMGFPGKYYSKNLTPTHLGDWTDGEILRAITSGVDKDGNALFPVMPYSYYAQMDKEDVLDIIAYIRSLRPIESKVPESESDFPMNFIINTFPRKPHFANKPDKSDQVQYGKYLVSIAACKDCHSPVNRGQIIADKAFSGGRAFEMPGGTLRSANITPDETTGIGLWTNNMFVNRFKAYEHTESLSAVPPGTYNTVMPWSMYAGMERKDLEAIYTYLKTLQPIKNQVAKYTAKP